MRRNARFSWLRKLMPTALLGFAMMLPAGPALAACHSFTVEVDPGGVGEGRRVTVIVRRDAAVAPSQIDVSTMDGTASAGEDYRRLDRTVSFTGETEQRFRVRTIDDDADEPRERFSVRLSNPSGCAPNPNFAVGPDARVTIRDDDAAPSPTPEPEETSPSPLAAPTPTVAALEAEETGGGLSGPAIAVIIAVILAIGALAWGLLRRRGAGIT
ncbi:MAG: Calx-beta domain-containing protein [Actinomycetota bacterium]